MKKILSMFIAAIIMMSVCICYAADYTLPEKMYNQLAIGSGLKGSFSVKSEGDMIHIPVLNNLIDTRFIRAVSEAEYKIRGIQSGKDLHYYVFQGNEQEQLSALSELYQKDGVFYFRSDIVPGKILSFPTREQFVEKYIPAGGENISPVSFISNILSVPERERKDNWDPILIRYQNDLEMWLAGFTISAETVKLQGGSSAIDFSYEIPMGEIFKQIIALFSKLASDPEAGALLDTVMTQEEKDVYLNPNLIYYYQEALDSFDQDRVLKIYKRVSAMGEVLKFSLDMPLDDNSTGYESLRVESLSGNSFYTLKSKNKVIVWGTPDIKDSDIDNTSFEKSIWISRVCTDPADPESLENFSVRIDIKKTGKVYKQGEGDNAKNHEEDQYEMTIENDQTYLPAEFGHNTLAEIDPVTIKVNLHYSSKYAQNNATKLEIQAEAKQQNSRIAVEGTVTSAAPWNFMPFEINDPISVGTDTEKELIPYLRDWVSNAESIIVHKTEEDPAAEEKNGSSEPVSTQQDSNASGQE